MEYDNFAAWISITEITDLIPKDVPKYMLSAWQSCMSWAVTDEQTVQFFREDTGVMLLPLNTTMDIPHDVHCDDKVLRNFIAWANDNVWSSLGDAFFLRQCHLESSLAQS